MKEGSRALIKRPVGSDLAETFQRRLDVLPSASHAVCPMYNLALQSCALHQLMRMAPPLEQSCPCNH